MTNKSSASPEAAAPRVAKKPSASVQAVAGKTAAGKTSAKPKAAPSKVAPSTGRRALKTKTPDTQTPVPSAAVETPVSAPVAIENPPASVEKTGAVASFHDLDLAPEILKKLDAVGFTVPTPIQTQAIPIVMTGKDLIGIAQTGTGKTLAFGLPILQHF